jgi:hypothetical protein
MRGTSEEAPGCPVPLELLELPDKAPGAGGRMAGAVVPPWLPAGRPGWAAGKAGEAPLGAASAPAGRVTG